MIIYFSGTGNTRLVAERIAEILGDDIVRIGKDTPTTLSITEGERVVWAFPVYSWGVPPVMRQFIAQVRFTSLPGNHFMVCTCGDDAGLTYEMWSNDIEDRGWTPCGGFSVFMPNVYVSLPTFDVDSVQLTQKKLDVAKKRVEEIANAIKIEECEVEVYRGVMAKMKTKVIYPWFMRKLTSPEKFRHTDACVECGVCERSCPMGNIEVRNGGPRWGDNCAMCLACYHSCPQHAIEYGRSTKGKGQYFAPRKFPK